MKKNSVKKDTQKSLNERTECGDYFFKYRGVFFVGTIVGSYCGDNWRSKVNMENFGVFLVKGDVEDFCDWGTFDGVYTVNSDYLVGKATPLMKALL